MKQIWPNYSYSPTTNVLTLTGLNIDRDQLLLVSAPERGRIMYNFADSTVTASAFTAGANTGLTLVASTAGLTTTAALVIYYDDQVAGISGTVTVGNISSLPDSAGNRVSRNFVFGYNYNSELPVAVAIEGTSLLVAGSVTIGSALPAGTNRIGVVTIGGGTVTIGAGTAQIGSVTVSSLPAISGTVTANVSSQDIYQSNSPTAGSSFLRSALYYENFLGGNGEFVRVNDDSDGGLPVRTASGQLLGISGTVIANTFAVQGTAVTTSNFTSTTASTVLANYNATREVLTIFNEGAGNLHIAPGATCTTIAYQVRLAAGDYFEVPSHQTTITHSAVFATAGTARVTEVT